MRWMPAICLQETLGKKKLVCKRCVLDNSCTVVVELEGELCVADTSVWNDDQLRKR